MKLSELINSVHKDVRVKELGLRKHEVIILVKVVVEHMFAGLVKYGKLKLQNLFSLEVKEAKGRRIRNPQTKEIMYSKNYNKIVLAPSKKLKEDISKNKYK